MENNNNEVAVESAVKPGGTFEGTKNETVDLEPGIYLGISEVSYKTTEDGKVYRKITPVQLMSPQKNENFLVMEGLVAKFLGGAIMSIMDTLTVMESYLKEDYDAETNSKLMRETIYEIRSDLDTLSIIPKAAKTLDCIGVLTRLQPDEHQYESLLMGVVYLNNHDEHVLTDLLVNYPRAQQEKRFQEETRKRIGKLREVPQEAFIQESQSQPQRCFLQAVSRSHSIEESGTTIANALNDSGLLTYDEFLKFDWLRAPIELVVKVHKVLSESVMGIMGKRAEKCTILKKVMEKLEETRKEEEAASVTKGILDLSLEEQTPSSPRVEDTAGS